MKFDFILIVSNFNEHQIMGYITKVYEHIIENCVRFYVALAWKITVRLGHNFVHVMTALRHDMYKIVTWWVD